VVAHLVRLKLDLLRNTLRRSRAQAIGMILGVAYAGFVVVGLTIALASLRGTPDLAPVVVTLGGAAGFVLWTLMPIFAFGSDPTVDPTRFATFSIRPRDLAVGLIASALVGLPAIASGLLGLGVVVASSQTLASTLMALVSVPIGLLTAITVSRWVSALATGAVSSRRGRDVTAVVGVLMFVLVVPAVSILGGSGRDWTSLAERTATVVGWTPIGWAWAAPGDLADGHAVTGLVRLALALLGLVVALRLWSRAIRRQVEAPLGTHRGVSQAGDPADLGLLGRVPDDATWAVAARTATYWARDPRYQVSMFLTPLAPLALLIPFLTADIAWPPLLMGPLAVFLLSWSEHNSVAYESTAFWMHVASGISGRSDRLGRLLPNMVLSAVLVPAYAVAGVWVGGRWELLPAVAGLSLALLGAGYAVSSVLSVALPYEVPKPGESPFHSPPGAAGMTMLSQTVASLGTAVLAAPVIILGLLAWSGSAWASWAALATGAVLAPLLLWLGVRLGGSLYERRAPELLLTLVGD
jgi:ABC-2 type transport system permease protein